MRFHQPYRPDSLGPTYHSGGPPSPWSLYAETLQRLDDETTERLEYDLDGAFVIALKSDRYRPSHRVTLRNQHDGWKRDHQGEFWNGYWFFRVDPDRYPQQLAVRFYLDGLAMESDPLVLSPEPNVTRLFHEHKLSFPVVTGAYLHGIDNLDPMPSKLEQELIPGNVDETIVYDVIVIGSGMGGGVLADTLSDLDVKTLVLEAGGLLFPTHIDNLPGHTFNFSAAQEHEVGHYINKPGTSSSMVNGVQMNLGGRSVFWEGLIPRMDDWELDHWPTQVKNFLRSTGYAEAEKLVRSRRTLGPFQDLIVSLLDAELCDYHVCDLPRSRHQPNLDSTRTRITNVIEQSTGVFSTADLLLDSLTTDPYIGRNFLTINLNHLVTSIETKDSRAVAVHCRDLAGNVERRFVASHIVLAAGSLESPRVALASGLNDPYHKMGIGLTDHPAYVHDDPVEIDPTSIHAGAEHHAKILIRHRDGASHPYWAELVINPRYWDVRHSDDEVLRLATRSTTKTFATMKFLFDSPLNDDNSIEYRGPGQKLVVNVAANLRGIPYETEVTGLRNRVFTFLNAVFDPTKKMDYHCNGSVHHAGGSLRMSDDHSGVVDENLKFEAYDNLYCCDVSTFPRIPTANPSLTLIALAQRLAARLKSIT